MAKGNNQKLKMLYLARIFAQETDEDNALTLQQIAEKLAAYDVNADRKTLYLDFEELQRFGLDIISEKRGRNTYYYLGSREFELPELKLLVDSVQAAKFITDRKSRELIDKLEGLVSTWQARQLHRQVIIAGRVKTMNESIYYNIDKLHNAINANLQIRFQYSQWTVNKEMALRRGGKWYQVSPWCLTWDDENYYLVAYDDESGLIKHYRVDKMLRLTVTDEKREGEEHFKNFDMALYSKKTFGMYSGRDEQVTLRCTMEMADVIIDRFGHDVLMRPNPDGKTFDVTVKVSASHVFLTWVMNFGENMKIVAPDHVIEQQIHMAENILKMYRK